MKNAGLIDQRELLWDVAIETFAGSNNDWKALVADLWRAWISD